MTSYQCVIWWFFGIRFRLNNAKISKSFNIASSSLKGKYITLFSLTVTFICVRVTDIYRLPVNRVTYAEQTTLAYLINNVVYRCSNVGDHSQVVC